MNTAVAEISTADTFFQERALRDALVRSWRSNPKQNAASHAAYAMIRGKSLYKTFSPLIRPQKLAQFGDPYTELLTRKEEALQGSKSAWKWASDVFEQTGISQDRYGRYQLKDNPILWSLLQRAQEQYRQESGE